MALRPVAATGRRNRRPSHPFQVRHKPWQVQPFMIAPVLPGETMKNLLMQSRVVSDPVKHPLIGWWLEYYFFYVKHRDLPQREHLMSMMLDMEYDTSSMNAATHKPNYYTRQGQMDWVQMCVDRIVETYFRDEDETAPQLIDGMHAARLNLQNWMDSLINVADYSPIEDIDVDLDADGTITAGEIDEAMRNYQWLKVNGLTDMSYEDFLGTYGVRPRPEEFHRPELLRYLREWTYPTNHIDPTDGSPSSALSWSIAERADKDRFFREPGFIIGLTVARPKVYLRNQVSTLTGVMRDALSWLPAILADDPYTSIKSQPPASAPLHSTSAGYVYDLKDLFLYGEQFVNVVLDATASSVALPTNGIQHKYASLADADDLFAGNAKFVRQDGVTNLQILGAMVDTTPQGIQG